MNLHVNCGPDGSVSHYRCGVCKGLVLVATGAMAERERKARPAKEDLKTTRILPDADLTPLPELAAWLRAYARRAERESRKTMTATQTIVWVAVQYALDEQSAGSRRAYEDNVRSAMRRVRELLVEGDEENGVAT